jgi:dTDP-D-glucose 4,6-dehydratase
MSGKNQRNIGNGIRRNTVIIENVLLIVYLLSNHSRIVETIEYTVKHVAHRPEHDSREYCAASYEYRFQ